MTSFWSQSCVLFLRNPGDILGDSWVGLWVKRDRSRWEGEFTHLFAEAAASVQFSSGQSLSRVRLFATPWIATHQASLSITNSLSLLKLMPIESVMPSSHLILCRPLLLLPPIPPSIRVFSSESTLCMRWPKYWSFNFSISPSNEHPGLISFSWMEIWNMYIGVGNDMYWMILLANFIYAYNPYELHVFIVMDTGFVVKWYFKVKDHLPF